MSKLKLAIFALLLCIAPQTFAAPQKASTESIKQLLSVTEIRKLLDGMSTQLDGVLRNSMQQTLRGKSISPEQQKILDDMRAELLGLVQAELSWDKMEGMYVRIYQDSFSQEEVDGMIAFYQTPAGKALIRKMPQVTQATMLEMQKSMSTFMPKLQKIQQEAVAKLQATK